MVVPGIIPVLWNKPVPTLVQETSAAADNTLASGLQGYTAFDRAWQVNNLSTVFRLGIYSTTARTAVGKIVLYVSTSDVTVVVSQTMSHGGTGWEWFALATPYTVPATGTYHAGYYTATGNHNVVSSAARSYKSGDITGNNTSGWFNDSANGVVCGVEY